MKDAQQPSRRQVLLTGTSLGLGSALGCESGSVPGAEPQAARGGMGTPGAAQPGTPPPRSSPAAEVTRNPDADTVLSLVKLGAPPWPTYDPFLFCVHHHDEY